MRELLKHYRMILLIGSLLLSMLLLFSANLRRQGATSFFERSVLALSSPLLQGIDGAVDRVWQIWSDYLWLVDTRQENRHLLEETRQLRVRLQVHREYRLENERLRRLLSFAQTIDRPVLPAQVIAEDVSTWARTILIDKGTAHGLKEGLPVVVAEGAVGQTIKCGPYQSRVLLITDASAALASLVQRTRTRGLSRGQGDQLQLEFALREEDLVAGDTVLTSGMGGVYPKGIVIGQVSNVERGDFGLFQQVSIVPAADFNRLEEVLILLEAAP